MGVEGQFCERVPRLLAVSPSSHCPIEAIVVEGRRAEWKVRVLFFGCGYIFFLFFVAFL